MPRPRLTTLLFAACLVAATLSMPAPLDGAPRARETHSVSAKADDPALLGRPNFTLYDDTSGLPQNSIQSMAFDSRQYLWVGTQDGAAFFNGTRWTVVDMPNRQISNYVNALCASSDGSVWFATDKAGLSRLKDGQWTTFTTDSGLPDDTVRALAETRTIDGRTQLWAGTTKGLARFENGAWSVILHSDGLPDDRIYSIAVEPIRDGDPVLWVGTENGVGRLASGVWTAWRTSEGIPDSAVQSVRVGPEIDGRRSIWVGTNAGVGRLRDNVWTTIDLGPELASDVVRDIRETVAPDGTTTLWLATIRHGLGRWRDGQLATFINEPTVSSSAVSSLYETVSESGQQTLWVGYNGTGLARIDSDQWLTFDERSGLPSHAALSFGETKDEDGGRSLWFGTRGGLAHYKGGSWTVYDTKDGLPGLGIRAILQTTSTTGSSILWVGTTKGLARMEGGRWSVLDRSTGLPSDEILDLLEVVDDDGSRALWISTGGGLARIDAQGMTIYDTSNGLPHERVQCVVETTSATGVRSIWAGTDGGLAHFENGRWRVFTTADGLANNVVLGLTLDERDGHRYLWAGTFGGASRLDLSTSDVELRTFTDTTEPTLPNNTVYQVRRDAKGQIYFFTNKGVARFTPREPTADNRADYSVYTFTTADGLPSSESNIGASMVDSRGRIWVGTVKGIAMLDPSKLPDDTTQKPLVVERVLVNDVARQVDRSEPLGYDENDVVFEYALLSYFRGADSSFRTELVGHDDAPTGWSHDPKRTFTNLPAGSFEFRVWGRDYAGNVTGPVSIAFRIRPAPWNTWWAYALYVVGVGGIGYGLARYRLQTLRRKNEQLETKIGERTVELAEKVELLRASEQTALEASRAKSTFLANMSHELRTPLNAILGFVQLMERDGNRTHEDREHLSIIGRSGEHLLALINDVLSISKIEAGQFTLNTRAFDLPALLHNVEEMFRLRAQAKGLQLIVEPAPDLPQFVSGDDGKLRQILINLLGNAFKFTDSGGVALRVRWVDGVSTFEVEDTGQGIAESEIHRLFEAFVQTTSGQISNEGTGLGLAITRNYIEMMGGNIEVASEEGRGTRFTFVLPFAIADEPDTEQQELRVVGLETNQPAYRVLVVDDKWENRRLLAKLLFDVGFQVQEAANGDEAVAQWTSWQPEVIWMDIQMPVLDGYEATRQIRALESERQRPDGRRTVILAVTASAFTHDRAAIVEAGCDDFVPKPFRNTTIFEKMAEHAGVRFTYSRTAHEPRPARGTESVVTEDRIAALPPELLASLTKAVVQGDIELALDVSDEISRVDAPLGQELRNLVRNYRFDDILDRVGKA